jgi:hypothetical protein
VFIWNSVKGFAISKFRTSASKQFLGTTVFCIRIQCYLDLTVHIFSSCRHGNTMSTVAASLEYHCWTLVVIAITEVVVMWKLFSMFPWMRTYSINVSKKEEFIWGIPVESLNYRYRELLFSKTRTSGNN